MNWLLRLLVVAQALLGVAALPAPTFAQQALTTAVCMIRPNPEIPDVGVAFLVIPATAQSSLSTRGYVRTGCVEGQINLAAYRTKFCDLAAGGDAAGQDKISRTYNATPAEICEWAISLTAP